MTSSSAGLVILLAAGSAAAQTQDQPTSVEDIVVTGEKTDRSLQDTPTSVGVVTSRRVEQEAIQTLGEVFQRTANLTETYGHTGFTIRGVNNQGVSGGGDAALTTIYVDGAPLPPTITFSGPTDAWDMRQIEIFRGPESTLQGLNALAGSVVMRTIDPTFDWDLRARAIVAEPEETAFAVAGGGPLIADELAFRLSAEKRDGDGFTHNETLNAPEDPIDSLTVRGRLLWTPKSLPGFEARLGYTRFESDGGYLFSYTNTDVPDFYDNRRAFSDTPNTSHVETDLATLELSQVLSDKLTLSSVTSWSDIQQFQQYDGDGTAANTGYGFNAYDYDTLTQEVRLNYRGERVHGLIGAFYYDRDQHANSASRTNVPTPVNTIAALLQSNGLDAATASAVANLYARALPVIPVNYSAEFPSQVTTYALFGDGEWNLTDRLSVVGGFRWDHEENTVRVTQSAAFVGTYPDPAAYGPVGSPLYLAVTGINAGVAGLVAQAGSATPEATRDFDAFLPKLGLLYDVTPDVTAGFVVQRGYRSGGSSANTARSQVFAYDPEYTWNYEASLRSTWLDGALTVNANAYYVDWTDQQVSVNFGLNLYDNHTVNAGKSHLYGFEVETTHRLNTAFDWYASLGFSRTQFDEFTTSVGGTSSDLSGSEFSYAPRWTLALGGNYRWGSGFVANLNANYRSEVFTSTGFSQDESKVGGRTLVNGRVGYETLRWGAYVYAKNLLDEQYMSYNRTDTAQAVLGDPRVVGLMLQARW
ncbi:TonB-dependent receptor [Brevundimonas vesicularis]|uniref:TonB-dependent receptor n=1 Tax=Brevundimonas vesicularis TaxID=41276 RepID=UPI0027D7A7EA|nr:TonB-dependent receptor [Brevundimonas vesicularis]